MVKKYKIKLYKSPIYERFESVMKNKRRGCTAIVWCSLFFSLYEKNHAGLLLPVPCRTECAVISSSWPEMVQGFHLPFV